MYDSWYRGFFEHGKAGNASSVIRALANFRQLATLIGHIETSPGRVEEKEVITKLFDQDGLCACLGTLQDTSIPAKQRGALARFMIQMARIELWLHGYDVRPNNDVDGLKIEASGDIDHFEFDTREKQLFKAL